MFKKLTHPLETLTERPSRKSGLLIMYIIVLTINNGYKEPFSSSTTKYRIMEEKLYTKS
jgi:hypothetical protein